MTKPVNVATYLAAAMLTTYYFNDPEEALRRAKAAGKHPGRFFGGIALPSGKRAFAVYELGEIVERYAVNNAEVLGKTTKFGKTNPQKNPPL